MMIKVVALHITVGSSIGVKQFVNERKANYL